MKEIKAYIRTGVLAETVEALEEARAPGITIVTVHPVGYGFMPNYFTPEYQGPVKRYDAITKLEIVCRSEDADRLVEAIRSHSCSGAPGDGMIFVSPVERAIKIRTGEQGESILKYNSSDES